MRRILPFLLLMLAGCSNAPIAGFLDNCFPSRAKRNPDTIPPPPKIDPIGPPIPPTPTPTPTPIPPPAGLVP